MSNTNLEKYAMKVAKDFRKSGSMDNYHFSEVALILEELVNNLRDANKVVTGRKQDGYQPRSPQGKPIPPDAE